MNKLTAALALALTFSAPALAAPRTVTLVVEDMTCSTCPITIKKVLSRVAGVQKIDFRVEAREVYVTFDDAKTSAQVLTKATENAGYPSRLK